jgi:chemotaxis protein methyltransferase WspC
MSLPGVEAVVRQRFGLETEALGAAALPLAIEKRMTALGVTADDYPAIVSADPAERLALAAELVVPETWFFRGGRRLFDTLAKFVSASVADTPVRVLSVPCSTGEEPYSLALALHEQPVAADAYRIEGVDLSAAHVARAAAGWFSAFAFRVTGPGVRAAHFRQSVDRWELPTAVRETVRFRVGNAADPNFLAGEAPFDLVLCRNLFIYLTSEARRQAMANLDRLLAPDGWLILSPAEADRLPPGRFAATGLPEFGIYRRADSGVAVQPIADLLRPTARKPIPRTPPPLTRVVARTTRPECAPRSEPVAATATLGTARELADAGRLAEARAACERLIAGNADDADAYALLGSVRLAEGSPADAAEAFRKALYLDPNHAEAIGHMIVICDTRGDMARAAALRKRLARLTAGEST